MIPGYPVERYCDLSVIVSKVEHLYICFPIIVGALGLILNYIVYLDCHILIQKSDPLKDIETLLAIIVL